MPILSPFGCQLGSRQNKDFVLEYTPMILPPAPSDRNQTAESVPSYCNTTLYSHNSKKAFLSKTQLQVKDRITFYFTILLVLVLSTEGGNRRNKFALQLFNNISRKTTLFRLFVHNIKSEYIIIFSPSLCFALTAILYYVCSL